MLKSKSHILGWEGMRIRVMVRERQEQAERDAALGMLHPAQPGAKEAPRESPRDAMRERNGAGSTPELHNSAGTASLAVS